jgi:uncharacterized YigZ family protein
MSYLIPADTLTVEHEIKNSRFIAYVAHVSTKEDVSQILHKTYRLYPNASHYCYAFLIGNPIQPTTVGFNDAGEPKGSAGKPILTVLEHSTVGDIVAIVIRYFGGTLLGMGGLSRAYSNVVQEALQKLATNLKVETQLVKIELPYTVENTARYLITEYAGKLHNSSYQAILTFEVELPKEHIDSFIQKLTYQSKAAVKIISIC